MHRLFFYLILSCVILSNSGCAIVNRFDTMITDLRGMRNQLTAINQTNDKLDQMNRQLLSVEQQLYALQETNSGIRKLSTELNQVSEGINRVDSNMVNLLSEMTGE